MCTVTVTDSTGKTTQANTAVSTCGYNQDNLWYCPYALGDAPIQAILTALNTANFYSLRSQNCAPSSSGTNCAYLSSKFSKAVNLAYNQLTTLTGNLKDSVYFETSPLFANNGACIIKSLTASYFGGSLSKIMGVSVLALTSLLF